MMISQNDLRNHRCIPCIYPVLVWHCLYFGLRFHLHLYSSCPVGRTNTHSHFDPRELDLRREPVANAAQSNQCNRRGRLGRRLGSGRTFRK